MALFKSSSP